MAFSDPEPRFPEDGAGSGVEIPDVPRQIVMRSKNRRAPLDYTGATDATIVRSLIGGRSAPSNWCLRPLIFVYCLAPPLAITLLSLLAGATTNDIWPAEWALGIASLLSLIILGDRPLINPLQAFVLLFHWWFSCGPAICAAFFYTAGDLDNAGLYLENHAGSLWVVTLGLPIFAICARLTLGFARKTKLGLRFLLPSGLLYSSRTLMAYAGVAAGVYAFLFILGLLGMHAFQTLDYLGNELTVSPGLAALSSVMRLGRFAAIGLLGLLAAPVQANWKSLRIVIVLVILVNMGLDVDSGGKGPIVEPLFMLGLLLFTYRQRVPWVLLFSLLFFYVVLVEPFVASSRLLAQRSMIIDSDQRIELFQEQLKSLRPTMPDWRQINVESPFRGVYRRAAEIAAISSVFSGPWAGKSLRDGYSSVVPRFLDPNKADSNMGNFFAHELGVSGYDDEKNNIAISIPFEVVGNYGFAAGILSFGVIGFGWTLFVCLILSEARLSTHPLMPYVVLILLAFEQSAGQFVNGIKDLPIALTAAWLVWTVLRQRQTTRHLRALPT